MQKMEQKYIKDIEFTLNGENIGKKEQIMKI